MSNDRKGLKKPGYDVELQIRGKRYRTSDISLIHKKEINHQKRTSLEGTTRTKQSAAYKIDNKISNGLHSQVNKNADSRSGYSSKPEYDSSSFPKLRVQPQSPKMVNGTKLREHSKSYYYQPGQSQKKLIQKNSVHVLHHPEARRKKNDNKIPNEIHKQVSKSENVRRLNSIGSVNNSRSSLKLITPPQSPRLAKVTRLKEHSKSSYYYQVPKEERKNTRYVLPNLRVHTKSPKLEKAINIQEINNTSKYRSAHPAHEPEHKTISTVKSDKKVMEKKGDEKQNKIVAYDYQQPRRKEIYRRLRKTKFQNNNVLHNFVKQSIEKVENTLDSQENIGASALSEIIDTYRRGQKIFSTVQKASPNVLKATIKCGFIGGKAVVKMGRISVTTAKILTGRIKLNRATAALVKSWVCHKINTSRPVKEVKVKIGQMKATIKTAHFYMVKGKNGVIRTVTLTKGIIKGTVKVNISKEVLLHYTKKGLVKGLKVGGKVTVKTVKQGAASSIKAGKVMNKGISNAGEALISTDNMGTQALGYTLKTVHYTAKGVAYTPTIVKKSYKGIKKSVKATIKTAVRGGKGVHRAYRGVKTGIKVTKKVGAKKALKIYSRRWKKSISHKVKKTLSKAGRSIVSVIVNGVKGIGIKALMPLLIILILVVGGFTTVANFGAAIISIFSPFSSDREGNEIEETSWLANHISLKRTELVQEVKDIYNSNLVENGGSYHYVRFFNSFSDSEIELSEINIMTSIYSTTEYQGYIQPIYHTLLLSEYELEAGQDEMEGILNKLWSSLTSINTKELPMEFCFSGALENDGNIHADPIKCPNRSGVKYHEDDTSKPYCSCDYQYYVCNGHKGYLDCGQAAHYHTYNCYDWFYYCYACGKIGDCGITSHDVRLERSLDCETPEHEHEDWELSEKSGYYSTSIHPGKLVSDCGNSEKHKDCNGYFICEGHKILSLSIGLGNFNDLLNEYFVNDIQRLEGKSELSVDEARELKALKDNYEICLNYLDVLEEGFGAGEGTVVDFGDVTLTALTEFACQFIGNPYVWGGNDPNTGADCSGFTKYVYAHFGVILPRVASQQVATGKSVSVISEAKEGDLIFWSDNGTDQGVYHVAIYLGNGKIVHASNSKPYPQGGIKVSNLYGTIYKIKRIAE